MPGGYKQLTKWVDGDNLLVSESRSFFDLCPRSLRMKQDIRWAIQDQWSSVFFFFLSDLPSLKMVLSTVWSSLFPVLHHTAYIFWSFWINEITNGYSEYTVCLGDVNCVALNHCCSRKDYKTESVRHVLPKDSFFGTVSLLTISLHYQTALISFKIFNLKAWWEWNLEIPDML